MEKITTIRDITKTKIKKMKRIDFIKSIVAKGK